MTMSSAAEMSRSTSFYRSDSHVSKTTWSIAKLMKATFVGAACMLSPGLIPRAQGSPARSMKAPAAIPPALSPMALFGVDGFDDCGRYASVHATYDALDALEFGQREGEVMTREEVRQQVQSIFIDHGECSDVTTEPDSTLRHSLLSGFIYLNVGLVSAMVAPTQHVKGVLPLLGMMLPLGFMPAWRGYATAIMQLVPALEHFDDLFVQMNQANNILDPWLERGNIGRLQTSFTDHRKIPHLDRIKDFRSEMARLHQATATKLVPAYLSVAQKIAPFYREALLHHSDAGEAARHVEYSALLMGLLVPLLPALRTNAQGQAMGALVAVSALSMLCRSALGFSRALAPDELLEVIHREMSTFSAEAEQLQSAYQRLEQQVEIYQNRCNDTRCLSDARDRLAWQQILAIVSEWKYSGNTERAVKQMMHLDFIPSRMSMDWASAFYAIIAMSQWFDRSSQMVDVVDASRRERGNARMIITSLLLLTATTLSCSSKKNEAVRPRARRLQQLIAARQADKSRHRSEHRDDKAAAEGRETGAQRAQAIREQKNQRVLRYKGGRKSGSARSGGAKSRGTTSGGVKPGRGKSRKMNRAKAARRRQALSGRQTPLDSAVTLSKLNSNHKAEKPSQRLRVKPESNRAETEVAIETGSMKTVAALSVNQSATPLTDQRPIRPVVAKSKQARVSVSEPLASESASPIRCDSKPNATIPVEIPQIKPVPMLTSESKAQSDQQAQPIRVARERPVRRSFAIEQAEKRPAGVVARPGNKVETTVKSVSTKITQPTRIQASELQTISRELDTIPEEPGYDPISIAQDYENQMGDRQQSLPERIKAWNQWLAMKNIRFAPLKGPHGRSVVVRSMRGGEIKAHRVYAFPIMPQRLFPVRAGFKNAYNFDQLLRLNPDLVSVEMASAENMGPDEVWREVNHDAFKPLVVHYRGNPYNLWTTPRDNEGCDRVVFLYTLNTAPVDYVVL